MKSSSRFRYFNKRRHGTEDTPPRKAEIPFTFKINPKLRPVLERIGVPEPKPFVPDPFQLDALEALRHSDVLVTAPTGAGKTYIAVKAIEEVYGRGGKCWYASPLKALSNAKYEEFSGIFGAHRVGILTGDRKENPNAPIIVGTTEILRNQLYDTMHRGEDLGVDLVVLDEAHYLGDEDRGVVWEEVLIYLPPRVQLLLLSATIRNARQICDWLQWLRERPCSWVDAQERPVPLFPLFLFPEGELTPLGSRRGLYGKIRMLNPKSFSRNNFPDVPRLLEVLREANLLPAIFFLKSRADCEKAVNMASAATGSKKQRKNPRTFHSSLNRLLKAYPFLRNHQQLDTLKKARVGAHHGGQLPHWKLLLEKLMQEGQLDAIFSTSTVAAGVNFPARTVVIPQSDRFNGREFVELGATDLLQMTGRAGRRGMDEIGFVLVVPGPFQDPQLIHDLLRSPPDPINSQIRVNFSMVLNLLLSHQPEEIRTLFAASLATFQKLEDETHVTRELQAVEEELESWLPETACGSLEALAEARRQHMLLKEQIRKGQKSLRNQVSSWSYLNLVHAGRIFLSRRGTPYLAIGEPDQDHVESVRLAFPLRSRRGQVRTHWVPLQRIRDVGEELDYIPPLTDREEWEALVSRVESKPFRSSLQESLPAGDSPSLGASTRELSELIFDKASLPCDTCSLYAPCQKHTGHPFTRLLHRYFDYQSRIQTVQERLWHSFLHHLRFLQDEGYVTTDGTLTDDGMWASKLRLDQPLLISEGIRKEVFPSDDPALLSALIAPFVMDRERAADAQLSSLVWKHSELAKPFFKMLQSLQPLREHLQSEGFTTPPLPFWALVTVYYWAKGESWETLRQMAGTDEGDLAMVILRTADHLRQIESLSDTHPQLAASARQARETILREPVLVT